MTFPDRVAIASRNAHKLRELGRICRDWPVEWVTVETHDPSEFPDVEETEDTYIGNALLKARAVADALGVPAIADDSGIEVDALGGRPGVLSARFGGEGLDDAGRNAAMLRALGGVPHERRTARYRALIALSEPCGREAVTEGVVEGVLLTAPRGTGGFGYDPLFFYPPLDATFAEVRAEAKHAVSHRALAMARARLVLAEWLRRGG